MATSSSSSSSSSGSHRPEDAAAARHDADAERSADNARESEGNAQGAAVQAQESADAAQTSVPPRRNRDQSVIEEHETRRINWRKVIGAIVLLAVSIALIAFLAFVVNDIFSGPAANTAKQNNTAPSSGQFTANTAGQNNAAPSSSQPAANTAGSGTPVTKQEVQQMLEDFQKKLDAALKQQKSSPVPQTAPPAVQQTAPAAAVQTAPPPAVQAPVMVESLTEQRIRELQLQKTDLESQLTAALNKPAHLRSCELEKVLRNEIAYVDQQIDALRKTIPSVAVVSATKDAVAFKNGLRIRGLDWDKHGELELSARDSETAIARYHAEAEKARLQREVIKDGRDEILTELERLRRMQGAAKPATQSHMHTHVYPTTVVRTNPVVWKPYCP